MIRKIEFNNFYSFRDKQTISFLTSKKRSYDYFTSVNKKNGYNEQITSVAGIVSKNAAGKTNVMRALGFISFFVCFKDKQGVDFMGAYKTFFNNKRKSNFYIEFEINNKIYEYFFSTKNGLVMEESLMCDKDEVYIFSIKKPLVLNEKYSMDAMPQKTQDAFRQNMSFIAYAHKTFDIKILKEVVGFFENLTINISESGERISESVDTLASSFRYTESSVLKKRMEAFINNFDLGPKKTFDINTKEEQLEDGKRRTKLEIHSNNKIKDINKKIVFQYESTGTRTIYNLLAKIFFTLENQSTLVLDEVETGLHPEALSKLIQYFIDENEKGCAQLIFTTHSFDFLKKFKKDQVFFVEKNKHGESEILRLDKKTEKGRTEDNLFAKYKSGLYGAYPDIRI